MIAVSTDRYSLPEYQIQHGRRYALELCAHLVSREFRRRYRRSFFGWLWAIAQPLFRFVVLGVVFGKLLKGNTPNFASFLFSGLVFWQWFATGVSSVTKCAMDHQDLLLRPGLPRWTIPLTSALTDAIDLLAALPVLFVVLLFDGRNPTPWLALVPFTLIVELLLIIGFGMLLCVGNVYFRDVGFFVDVMLLMGFYVTPVFYEASKVPRNWRWIVDWNPMSAVLETQRNLVLYGRAPSWATFSLVTIFAMVVFVVGATVFNRFSGNFVDEL